MIDRATSLRSHALAFGGYICLVGAAFWKAIWYFRTRYLLQEGDGFLFVWAWWWIPHALRSGTNVFHTAAMFHPVGIDLAITTMAPAVGLVSWPVGVLLGPAAQVNAVQMAATFATALITYFLALRVTPVRAVAFLAGAAFALAPYRFVHLGHLNLGNVWPIPLAVLGLLRFADRPTPARGVALGVVLGGSILIDPQITLLAVTAVLVMGLSRRREIAGTHVALLAGAGVAVVVAMPVVIPMVIALMNGEADPVAGFGGAQYYSSDLLSWVLPGPDHPLLGFLGRMNPAQTSEGLAYPGFALSVLAVHGRALGDRDARRGWVAVALAALVLSLGPFLQIAGRAGDAFRYGRSRFDVPLPFFVLHLLPGLSVLRVPGRFVIIGVLAVDMLAARALGRLMSQRSRRRGIGLFAAVAFLTTVELFPPGLPTVSADVPAPYGAIAQDSDPGAVLELPMQWSTGTSVVGDLAVERYDAQLLRFVWTHHRALVSGSASRYPIGRLRKLTDNPLFRQVLALEDEPGYDDKPTFGAAELRAQGIAFVVYHRNRPVQRALAYFTALHLPVAGNDGTVIVWRVPQ